MARRPPPSAASSGNPGGDLQLHGLCQRRDEHQRVAEQVGAGAGPQQAARVQVVHPLAVGGEEHVRGRARLDLLGQQRACRVGGLHPMWVAALKARSTSSRASVSEAAAKTSSVVSGPRAGAGDRLVGPQERARQTNDRQKKAEAPSGRSSDCHKSPPSLRAYVSLPTWLTQAEQFDPTGPARRPCELLPVAAVPPEDGVQNDWMYRQVP